MGIKQYHLIVKGRVQGVGYRFYTQQYAQELGLTGWVKNLTDGSVEIVAAGNSDLLEQLCTWVNQGPRYADVSSVEVNQLDTTNHFNSFTIR